MDAQRSFQFDLVSLSFADKVAELQARLRSIPRPLGPEAKALPIDLYIEIFKMLRLFDLLAASCVSRAWRQLVRHPRYVTKPGLTVFV